MVKLSAVGPVDSAAPERQQGLENPQEPFCLRVVVLSRVEVDGRAKSQFIIESGPCSICITGEAASTPATA